MRAKGCKVMNVDDEFYSRRLLEELQLADAAQTPCLRNVHVRRADEYGRWLPARSDRETRDAVAEWRFYRRSDALAEWIAGAL